MLRSTVEGSALTSKSASNGYGSTSFRTDHDVVPCRLVDCTIIWICSVGPILRRTASTSFASPAPFNCLPRCHHCLAASVPLLKEWIVSESPSPSHLLQSFIHSSVISFPADSDSPFDEPETVVGTWQKATGSGKRRCISDYFAHVASVIYFMPVASTLFYSLFAPSPRAHLHVVGILRFMSKT